MRPRLPFLKGFFYLLYLFVCIELISKFLLFTPQLNDRFFNTDTGPAWRIRFFLNHFQPFFLQVPVKDRHVFDQYDPITGWTLKPDLKSLPVFDGKYLTSNSRGVRGEKEFSYEKPAGVRRIVIVGDSFTFGETVGDDETYPHYLGQILGEGAEVINLGVHGYGHDQIALRLKSEGLRYHPDVVVLGFYAEDLDRNLLNFRDYAKPHYQFQKGKLELRGVPVPSLPGIMMGEFSRLHSLDLFEILRAKIMERRGVREAAKLTLSAAILDEMRQSTETAGAKFVILYLPPLRQIFERPLPQDTAYRSFIRDYAATRQVLFCDPLAEFDKNVKAGAAYNRKGGHYGALLNHDAAQALAACLESKE